MSFLFKKYWLAEVGYLLTRSTTTSETYNWKGLVSTKISDGVIIFLKQPPFSPFLWEESEPSPPLPPNPQRHQHQHHAIFRELVLSIIFNPNLVTKESITVQEWLINFHFGIQTKPGKTVWENKTNFSLFNEMKYFKHITYIYHLFT